MADRSAESDYLTLLREWVDGEDTGEWPAPPEYAEYRVDGRMRLDVLARLGRAADDPCDVRMIQGLIEGGYSEFTVEHDYEIEVWVHEGRRAQKVWSVDMERSRDGALAAFLKWVAPVVTPPGGGPCREAKHHTAQDTGYYDPNGHAITEARWLEATTPPAVEAGDDRG